MRKSIVAVTMFSVIGLLLTAGAFAQVSPPRQRPRGQRRQSLCRV
jgi:hypothetical protein